MRNILMILRFDGTAYHGWQVQKNAVTVQETLQDAAKHILGKRENITGCSRTDTGVHANMYCCNMRTEHPMDCEKLATALNAVLPRDIAVLQCKEVPFEFHARYDCKSKEYIYRINDSGIKDPFDYKYSYFRPYPLDTEFLSKEASGYLGAHDFSAFCAAGSSVKDTVRTVSGAKFERDGNIAVFRVEADGFLYNMVRIMVGTLLDISAGKIPPGSIPEIIDSLDRNRAGFTAPAEGLFLNKIIY